jgi:hypothetical protein
MAVQKRDEALLCAAGFSKVESRVTGFRMLTHGGSEPRL